MFPRMFCCCSKRSEIPDGKNSSNSDVVVTVRRVSSKSNHNTDINQNLDEIKLENVEKIVYNKNVKSNLIDVVYDRRTRTPSRNTTCSDMGITVVDVKVEVHSSSSGAGSEENLSSSDLSERSAEQDHDYEDIYHIREGARSTRNNTKQTGRSRSRDSGSHSRSGSISSTNSGGIIMKLAPHPNNDNGGHDQPSMTPSTESGVSSASPSDLGGSEEENDKSKNCRSLPHQSGMNRPLKRVVSEPGSIYPPPPPPLPPADGFRQLSRRSSCADSVGNDGTETDESTLKASDVTKRDVNLKYSEGDGENEVEHHTNVTTVNSKHKVLPFIPPKFTSNGDDCLIKPSEYLKSIGTRVTTSVQVVNKDEVDKSEVKIVNAETGPIPPPLPERSSTVPSSTTSTLSSSSSTSTNDQPDRKTQQPLSTISIHDLNSVQLRRTDKTVVNKTMSAPNKSMYQTVTEPFQAQKQDLIAELKMSRDIEGVKKMKVERAKTEENKEKELVTEITKQVTANNMLDMIPERDIAGNPIPPWKRQMLAKKAAEKARKELEEQMQKEAEEKRLQMIPAWKRQLLAKKEETDIKSQVYTPRVSEEKKIPQVLIKVASETNNTTTTTEETDKENNRPVVNNTREEDDEDLEVHIIPWRAQLRKTNSKLNLLD